jgi:hypothetical protein
MRLSQKWETMLVLLFYSFIASAEGPLGSLVSDCHLTAVVKLEAAETGSSWSSRLRAEKR